MIKLYSLILIFALAGCLPPTKITYTGYETECIRGVVYYNSGHRLAPAYKQDGTLYTCDEAEALKDKS
jgi:hypothetical protein